MAKLNIALTLPGEGSLGAFEAGAVAALIVALQAMAQEQREAEKKSGTEQKTEAVCVDAITGASSGSLTAVLAAAALLTGEDPIAPLRRAWVSEPSFAALWSHRRMASTGKAQWGHTGPLSLARAREVGHALLGRLLSPEDHDSEHGAVKRQRRQPSPVTLEFALTCLRGFTYRIPRLTARTRSARKPLIATSYIDWSRHDLGSDPNQELSKEFATALDAAIASASDPLLFPPTLLDRSRDKAQYEQQRLENFPVKLKHLDVDVRDDRRDRRSYDELWYSDGALVDREPLGRCLRLVRRLDEKQADAHRLVLVIRPHADRSPGNEDPAWTGAGDPPRWSATLARAYRIMASHSLYEDLRHVEKANSRIAWRDRLVETLDGLLKANPEAAQHALGDVLNSINAEREALRRERDGSERQTEDNEQRPAVRTESVETLLSEVICIVAGVSGQHAVDVEIVAAPDSVQMTGGARGFLTERLRANDFLVGYREMLGWLETGLAEYRVAKEIRQAGVRAVVDGLARVPGWRGGISVSRRTAVRGSAQVIRAGLRAGRLGLREVRITRKPTR